MVVSGHEWSRDGDGWQFAAGESDNNTSPTPFERPSIGDSTHRWCDWHSNGGAGDWGDQDQDPWRHTFFGIAPTGTARLTVTDEAGRERDLRITPRSRSPASWSSRWRPHRARRRRPGSCSAWCRR
jgi:hypothetical protein